MRCPPSFEAKNDQSTGRRPVTVSIHGQPSARTLEALMTLASVAAAQWAADRDASPGDKPGTFSPSRTHHQT